MNCQSLVFECVAQRLLIDWSSMKTVIAVSSHLQLVTAFLTVTILAQGTLVTGPSAQTLDILAGATRTKCEENVVFSWL
eukprot:3882224-Amphidinium_carterae.1